MEIGRTWLFLFFVLSRTEAGNRFRDTNMCGIVDIRLQEPPERPEMSCPGDSVEDEDEGSGSEEEAWPWAGRITNTETGQHYLGVIIASDTIVGDTRIRGLSVTEDKLRFSVIHDEQAVHSSNIRSVNSDDHLLTYTLEDPIPPEYFRPVCLPPPGYISRMVKTTTCGGDTGLLTKAKMSSDGKLELSKVPLVDGSSCSLSMLRSDECVAHIMAENENTNNPLKPDKIFIDSESGRKKYEYFKNKRIHWKSNKDYYKCHIGAVKASQDCNLDEIKQEAKCGKADQEKCLGLAYKSGTRTVSQSDIEQLNTACANKIDKEYGDCVVKSFKDEMTIGGMKQWWSYRPYEGINCLHDYIDTPGCAEKEGAPGFKPLGDEWGSDPCWQWWTKKIRRGYSMQQQFRSKDECYRDPAHKYFKDTKPYKSHFSISMYESIDKFGADIRNKLQCDTCSGTNICVEEESEDVGHNFLFWFDTCREKWFFLGTQESHALSPSYPVNCKQPTVYREMEETAQLIRDQVAGKVQGIDLYPRPVVVVLGPTGVGKSTTGNALLSGNGQRANCFKTGSETSSKTKVTQWQVGKWLGTGQCVTLVDTPGTSDTSGGQQDYENIKELINFLKTDLKQIDIFLVMFKETNFRFVPEMKKAIDIFVSIFGETFWENMATEFTFWDYSPAAMKQRYNRIALSFEKKEYGDSLTKCLNGGVETATIADHIYSSPPGYGPQEYGPPGYGPQEYGPPGDSPQEYGPPGYGPQQFGPPESYEGYLPGAESNEEDFVIIGETNAMSNAEDFVIIGEATAMGSEVEVTDEMMCALITSKNISSPNKEIFHNQKISDANIWKQLKSDPNFETGGIQKDITDLEYEKADYVARFLKHTKWSPVYQQHVKTIPSLFIHPVWDLQSRRECQRFKRETARLMDIVNKMEPFVCSAKCSAPDEFFIGTPKILQYLEESSVDVKYENQLFTLTCTIWNGVSTTHLTSSEVTWVHGWTEINTAGRRFIQTINSGRQSTITYVSLEVKHLSEGDIGLYQCSLDDSNLVFSSASQISSDDVDEGSITLSCSLEVPVEDVTRRETEVKWYKAEVLSSDRQTSDKFSISFQPSDQFSVSLLTMNFNNGQPREFEKTFACKTGVSGFSNNVTAMVSKDAVWAGWQKYSDCSKTCQPGPGLEGSRTRKRECIDSRHNGKSCAILKSSESDSETVSCNTICCPINGIMKDWTIWKPCMNKANPLETQTCASAGGEAGVQNRTRVCEPPSCNGYDCHGDKIEFRNCNGYKESPCPIDGGWSEWGQLSKCILEKGKCSGFQERERKCDNPKPEHDGRHCLGSPIFKVPCTEEDKCPVDCLCNDWHPWGHCSLSCGNCGKAICNDEGTEIRKRGCSEPKNGGITCAVKYRDVSDQTRVCKDLKACKIDGKWSSYTGWTQCDKATGKKKRIRFCNPPQFGGEPCIGDNGETAICPVDCQCSGIAWGEWTQCSGSCGDGKQEKTRTCTAAKNNGVPCHKEIGGREEFAERMVQKCSNSRRCPKNFEGQWTPWGALSKCSWDCGGGTQRKTRTCLFPGTTGTSSDYDRTYDRKTQCVGTGSEVIGDDKNEKKCNLASCEISTLFFLMDTTGSFNSVHQNTALDLGKGLLKELVKRGIKVPRFQIVKIDDPTVTIGAPIYVQKDFAESLYNVYKQSNPGGNGNWPEKSTKGILDTVKSANANAVLCLFTDAATHDHNLETEIKNKLRDKDISLYIFLTPDYPIVPGVNEGAYANPTLGIPSFHLYQRLSNRQTYIMSKTEPSTASLVIEKALKKKKEGRCWTYAGATEWKNEPNECYFPFSYKGTTYTECTTAGRTQPWCATVVKKDPKTDVPVLSNKGGPGWEGWGYCGNCQEAGVDNRCKAGNHAVLKQSWRAVKKSGSKLGRSDKSLRAGWYKFDVPGTKNTIPQHFTGVPPTGKCGGKTHARIELPPSGNLASHKEYLGKDFLVCFDLQCKEFKQVKVLWCPPYVPTGKPFYIYELNPLADGQAYCVE